MSKPELKKILCIDDQADMRMLVKMALEKIGGYDVALCPTGYEAAQMAIEEKPDLILLDVLMPDPDGFAVIAILKSHETLKKIPVLFMTGKDMEGDVSELIESGADGVIPKPFDPLTLAENIAKIWESIHHG